MAYLAAVLREEGFTVRVLDAAGEDLDRLTEYDEFRLLGLPKEEILERIPADVAAVGISCMFSNEWIYLKEVIDAIKERFPRAVTVMGGEHASAIPAYCLESCRGLDYCICGEGEGPIVAFAKAVLRGEGDVRAVGGLAYRDGDRIVVNPQAPRLSAIDEIPFPAWDLLPVEAYLERGLATITRRGQRIMPMLATRGCPYQCKFCSNPQMYGTRYFIRDVNEVIREIKWLRETYRITGFEMVDLTFITKRPWVKEFCRRLLAEGIDLKWNVPTTRSEAIDEEVVELLKASGCANLTMTPDSGSPRMIEEMKKRVNLAHITKTVKTILRSGIVLKVNLVIGFPGERHRDVWQSLLYGIKLAIIGCPSIFFYRFVPYPGSEYYEHCRQRGDLPPYGPAFDRFLVKNIYNELGEMRSYSEHISDLMIRIYIFAGYLLTQTAYFLFRPTRILRTISNIRRNVPDSNVEILMAEVLHRLGFQRA